MSRPYRSLLAAFVVLMILGLLVREDPRRWSATSFGKVPSGHGAFYDLLRALDLPVERSYRAAGRLAAGTSVWWIEPRGICDTGEVVGENGGEGAEETSELAAFVQDGGTALVLFDARPSLFVSQECGTACSAEACSRLAGIPLPTRETPPPAARSRGDEEELSSEPPGPGLTFWEHAATQVVTGELVSEPRRLEMPRLARFRDTGAWQLRARIDADPFVLEYGLGTGRLVAVADATFLRNAWLDRADAAPLALDLVRRYGVDAIDERWHGLRLEQRSLRYLADSPALVVFLGIAVLGLLVFWRGTAVPPRMPEEPGLGSPTLEDYVESLATLGARTRDYARVAERYREFTIARLRRHLGLGPEISPEHLVDRLRREGRVPEKDLHALLRPASVGREAALRASIRRFDAILEEVCR